MQILDILAGFTQIAVESKFVRGIFCANTVHLAVVLCVWGGGGNIVVSFQKNLAKSIYEIQTLHRSV